MGIFGLLFLIIALVLIGIGLAVGLVLCAIAAALMVAGMVSTSAAVGLWFRRPAPAVRVLIYQVFLVLGICSGVVVAWLASTLFELGLQPAGIVGTGALSGAAAGIALAAITGWIFDCVVGAVNRHLARKQA